MGLLGYYVEPNLPFAFHLKRERQRIDIKSVDRIKCHITTGCNRARSSIAGPYWYDMWLSIPVTHFYFNTIDLFYIFY